MRDGGFGTFRHPKYFIICELERNWQGRDRISRDIHLTTNLHRPKSRQDKHKSTITKRRK